MTDRLAATRLALLAGLSLIALPTPLWAQVRPPTDPVAVSSTASADYARQKFGPGAPKPESYLFFQGKFYGGTTRDPDLETAQFNQIIRILAENMVRQNYFPSKDPKEADLLLVVHWGITTVYVNPNMQDDQERLNNEMARYNAAVAAAQSSTSKKGGPPPPPPDPGPLNAELAIVDVERGEMMQQVGVNAKLLGYSDQLAKDRAAGTGSSSGVSTAESNLLQDLIEERYFVILMAYDYHSMKKGSTPKLLWSTRFSIRAPGNAFTAALPVMTKAASEYFGRAVDGLKIEKPPAGVPEGKVEVGTPTVVGDGKGK
jgi:hypothetical protein